MLTECPIIVVLLFQLYPRALPTNISKFMYVSFPFSVYFFAPPILEFMPVRVSFVRTHTACCQISPFNFRTLVHPFKRSQWLDSYNELIIIQLDSL